MLPLGKPQGVDILSAFLILIWKFAFNCSLAWIVSKEQIPTENRSPGSFFKLAQVEVPTQLLLELLELEESGLEEKLAEELTRSSLNHSTIFNYAFVFANGSLKWLPCHELSK